MSGRRGEAGALGEIRQIDYTVIYTRDMTAMRRFYEEVMAFPLARQLSERWFEYRIGSTILALAAPGGRFDDPPPPAGALSVQLAFRVPPPAVARCAKELQGKGVTLLSPPTDHAFGHRTIFFRDPDGNVIEIYAEI
jgi:catechol 2,3-dioxygenase-like lactoylglutathione lyase family enzyme